MSWKDKCFSALTAEKMFENPEHSRRFRELVDCFSGYPFFSRGLCKCIYLSSWDEKHFCIILESLTALTLGNEKNTLEMRERGESLAAEQTDSEYYVFELANAFLDNMPFRLSSSPDITPQTRYIIMRALHAAAIIDRL